MCRELLLSVLHEDIFFPFHISAVRILQGSVFSKVHFEVQQLPF